MYEPLCEYGGQRVAVFHERLCGLLPYIQKGGGAIDQYLYNTSDVVPELCECTIIQGVARHADRHEAIV